MQIFDRNIVSSSGQPCKQLFGNSDKLQAVIFILRKKVIAMPRGKKRFPKLPNGYGQIRYLGKGRRNPYGVYPPAVEEYDNGKKKTPPAICYVSDRMVGLAVLTMYKGGTYKPGDEILIEQQMRSAPPDALQLFGGLIADYNKTVLSVESKNKPVLEMCLRNITSINLGLNTDILGFAQLWSAAWDLHTKIAKVFMTPFMRILKQKICRRLSMMYPVVYLTLLPNL